MKKWGILLLAALVGFALVGCQNNYLTADDLAGYNPWSKISCSECHNQDWTPGPLMAKAKTGYAGSGHALGLRGYVYNTTDALMELENEGTLSKDEFAAGCAKCHTQEGFQTWATNGAQAYTFTGKYVAFLDYAAIANNSVTAPSSSAVSCQACHTPIHTLRAADGAVKLPSGMTAANYTTSTVNTPVWNSTTLVWDNAVQTVTNFTDVTSSVAFDGGAGNLCVNCHQDRTSPASLNYKLGLTTVSTSAGTGTTYAGVVGTPTVNAYVTVGRIMHHGVQGDFLMGKDSAGYDATNVPNGYQVGGVAPTFGTVHYGITDTCAACHVTKNSNGHENYLVTAAGVEQVSLCQQCHTSGTDKAATTFVGINAATTNLKNIKAAELTLLTYFGDPTHFYNGATGAATLLTSAGAAPAKAIVAGVATSGTWVPADVDHIVWNKDWTYNSSNKYMTQPQAQALWNMMLVFEDRSAGVHNPVYAAQLLYDAINLLGLTQPTDWTARP